LFSFVDIIIFTMQSHSVLVEDFDEQVFNDQDVELLNSIHGQFRIGSICTYITVLIMVCTWISLLGLVIHAYPAAQQNVHLLARADKPLARAEHVVNAISGAAVTLASGNVATLIATISSQPWKPFALQVRDIFAKMANALLPMHNWMCYPYDYCVPVNTLIVVTSTVSSVANQIAGSITDIGETQNIADITPSAGQFGLILEPLNYASDLLVAQTNVASWSYLGERCIVVTTQLSSVNWENQYQCPTAYEPGQVCNWDGSATISGIILNIKEFCTALSTLKLQA
jgi:hypothetical protein